MARLRKLALKQGTTISGIKASRQEVLDTTGVRVLQGSEYRFLAIFRIARHVSQGLAFENILQDSEFPRTGLLTSELSTACTILTDDF